MAIRIIDPQRFILSAAVVDWTEVYRRYPNDRSASEIAMQRGISTRVVQLRWLLDPKLGYPTEPFRVWRRPSRPMESERPIAFTVYGSFPGIKVYVWQNPVVFLRAQIRVDAASVSVIAYAGAPFGSAVAGWENLNTGFHTVTFSGSSIACIVVVGDAHVDGLAGLTGQDDIEGEEWEPLERVGLPVNRDEWSGIFDLDVEQGFESELTEPFKAAELRFLRGAPFYGWEDLIEAETPAPAWALADPRLILKALEADLERALRKMITTHPPQNHHQFAWGQPMAINAGAQTAETRYAPIRMLMLGAASDPLFSLVAGFGTAFDSVDGWDYMVTARYSHGLDGASEPVEYAAVVQAPKQATIPPRPANLGATFEGLTPPEIRDQLYRGVVRLAWDKLPDITPFRIASYAAARLAIDPPSDIVSLMGGRKFDPLVPQPISATTSLANEQETGTLRSLDEGYRIEPASIPNRLLYAVAHQDLFGLWSPWSSTEHTLQEPPVQSARILSARFDVESAASAVCPANLIVDLTWDWAVRSPERLVLVGKLYAASKPGQPPDSPEIPTGLQKAFPGPAAGTPLVVNFAGNDSGSVTGAMLEYISDDGKERLAVPVVVAGPRRYRLTIPGFSLDFTSAGHVGMALWARGQEHIAPQRTGPWSNEPTVSSASDPRPPVITLIREEVELASLPDGRGEHRARLDWPRIAGAVGYYIYETTESKLRTDPDLAAEIVKQRSEGGGEGTNTSEALPGETLADRLLTLRNALHERPVRRPFIRVNATPITGLDAEVVIPRGSKDIHMYIVLGVSAGQVESSWPDLNDPHREKRFRAFVAPQIAAPSPPVLEVTLDKVAEYGYRACLAIETRPGAVVERLEIFRTRVEDAALQVDTMGPPIATITGSDAEWRVTPVTGTGPGDAQPLGIIRGYDQPDGSWKRVFYRAVAWSGNDPSRALYGGRSQPSAAMAIVVPPAAPPELAPIVADRPEGALSGVRFATTSPAPVDTTPLGPHRIKVEVVAITLDGSLYPVFAYPELPAAGVPDDTLGGVPTAPGVGLWREETAGDNRYCVLVSEDSVEDAVRIRIRILLTDPLGRTTERVLDAPGAATLPAPDIVDPTLTAMPGKGVIFGFKSHAPIPATPIGPYVLQVQFWSYDSPSPDTPVVVSADLPNIKLLQSLLDPFSEARPISLRRGKPAGGVTHFSVYLRGKGLLAVKLLGPDGQAADVTAKVE